MRKTYKVQYGDEDYNLVLDTLGYLIQDYKAMHPSMKVFITSHGKTHFVKMKYLTIKR